MMSDIIPGKDCIGMTVWAFIIDDSERILLIKRKGKDYWERPGGKLEYGELSTDALKREIKEETDVDIEIIRLVDINEEPDIEGGHWIGMNYLTRYVEGVPKVMEPEKHQEISWFDIRNLPQVSIRTKKAVRQYLESCQ